MEEFRHIGEVVGSLNALMVFQDDIQINQKQCCLLVEMINHAYKTVAEEMKGNLRFEQKNTKWKVLDNPFRQLFRVFREGEFYVKKSLDVNEESWWAKAISLYNSTDCVEFLLHDLLSIFPTVIEAVEMAGELSGCDQEEMQKRRTLYAMKYTKECKDPRIFQWKFGRQYLVHQHFCNRFQSVWLEDRQILINKLHEKKNSGSPANTTRKQDEQLVDLLLRNLDNDRVDHHNKILPSSILVGSKDYQVRRRLGSGGTYKEIQWLGESFALKHLIGDIDTSLPQISRDLTLSHPNIVQVFCGFSDDERKECFLVMELMSRDLSSYIKEICGPKKRLPFSLPVAVDLMLQIARGMEYLHSKNIYHGGLNPSKILLRHRNITTDGYLHAKVSGFGPSSINNLKQRTQSNQNGQLPFIWYAPEVLAEQEQSRNADQSKYSEKADVYSFGMICFQLLSGKVPFEDTHLQGDKMSRNIRAGERPLFPFHGPKYLTNLTKKCWNSDPNQRPSFSSICRILRYIKGLLVINPEQSNPESSAASLVDYIDIEMTIQRNCPSWESSKLTPISQIPYQMFVFRATEKERLNPSLRETSESGSDASACADETAHIDDPLPLPSIYPRNSSNRNESKRTKEIWSSFRFRALLDLLKAEI